MDPKVLEAIDEMSPEEFGDLFEGLAQRVYEIRLANNGFVPKHIFAACCGIGGVYAEMEVVIKVANPSGYALKLRSADEQGWHWLYHIPGQAVRMTDKPTDIFVRLTKEIFGPQAEPLDPGKMTCLGVEVHHEPERWSTCWTQVWLLELPMMTDLYGDWRIVEDPDDPKIPIVDHHRHTLKWAADPNRLPITYFEAGNH